MRLYGFILLALLTGTSFAQQGFGRPVTPPTVIPGGWETRKVGVVLNVTAIGTARTIAVTRQRQPVVELASNKGKTIRTTRGRNFTLAGVTFQSMGYKNGGNYYVLYAPARKKFYYFKTEK